MTPSLNVVDISPSLHGLVPVRGQRDRTRVDEEAAVREAAALGDIDYVFFRRFGDGRSSQVAAYVIDNSADRFGEAELAQVHRRVWLNGVAPLLYVGWETRVDVLSCARKPDFWKNNQCAYEPAERIPTTEPGLLPGMARTATDLSLALAQRYSAFRLGDGTFWDDPRNAPLAKHEEAAHRLLIEAVVAADTDIKGEKHPVLRRLLLLVVLVKYLEDRRVFPDNWFGRFHSGAASFFDVLKSGNPGAVRKLLKALAVKFNGDVFCPLEDDKDELTPKELTRFATLVEARTIGQQQQRYLWDQYSFQHLPVEVLSHLYQRFVQHGEGTVYTPPFLASLLLDYALPYSRMCGDEIVLDPTCGSGVFLVGAFRRLIHHWRSLNGWRRPDVPRLRRILKGSIFGAELQGEAVDLTAFSLALAVCDALKPKVIWRELKFDKLVDSNLFAGDFFKVADLLRSRMEHPSRGKGCDLVIGNPPFLSELSEAAATANREAEKTRGSLPDQQMAYLIAENSMSLLNQSGRLCLIQPAGFLYNEKVAGFRKAFMIAHQLERVLDFTSVRRLYDGADPKTVAVVAAKQPPKAGHRIAHLTFRRTLSVQERLWFELDHYDKHTILQQAAEEQRWVWRANLLGGGRLQQLAKRLGEMPTLEEFVKKKRWEEGYGEGFIAAKAGNREPAPWLTGKPLLPTRALTSRGIDESKISVVRDKLFRSAYTEARFSPPLVLIKENESLPCAFWDKGFLAYRAKIVGIHTDPVSRDDLRRFFQVFCGNREAIRAFCALFGTQALVGRSTPILKRDLDVLPWPENGDWELAPWERALCEDVVKFMCEYVRRGQNSALLRNAAKPKDLETYAKQFCGMLGSVYDNLRELSPPLYRNGLIEQAFCFGQRPEIAWPAQWESDLRDLVYVKQGESLRTARVLRFYTGNVIVIVKPDRLRYWIRSTAIRDADETLVDLRKQGY